VKNNLTVSVKYTADTHSITGSSVSYSAYTATSATVSTPGNLDGTTPVTGFKVGEKVTVSVSTTGVSGNVFTLTGKYTDSQGQTPTLTGINKTTSTDDSGTATFEFTMPAGDVTLTVGYQSATLTASVKLQDTDTPADNKKPTATVKQGDPVARDQDLTFTVAPSDDDHYIVSVTCSLDNKQNPLTAVNGVYTVSASDLATAAKCYIIVTQAEKPVLTNSTSSIVSIDNYTIAAGKTYQFDGDVTSLVVVVPNGTQVNAADTAGAATVTTKRTATNNNGYDEYTITFPAGTSITLSD
jgi:hypothetical protein